MAGRVKRASVRYLEYVDKESHGRGHRPQGGLGLKEEALRDLHSASTESLCLLVSEPATPSSDLGSPETHAPDLCSQVLTSYVVACFPNNAKENHLTKCMVAELSFSLEGSCSIVVDR